MARYKAVILAYLPNKKILFLIIFILLIFAGWFYFSDYKNKQIQYTADKEKSSLTVVPEQTNKLDTDTDGDGLKDWEELLWKTDPNKMDTDGDGTPDGEEINLGRNPLKAGPNDKISDKEDLVAKEKAVSDSNQNTVTAVYAKQFLTEYLSLKQQKGELTDEDKNNLVERLMNNIKTLAVADKYKISDLKISNDTSQESVEKYAEWMKAIFIDAKMPKMSESDVFTILLNSVKEKNFKNIELGVKSLNKYVVLNKEVTRLLLMPTIPENLFKNHIEIANGFNNIALAAENMAIVQNDPVKAMMGQKLYNEQMIRIYNAMKNLQEIFNEYEITVFK